MSSTDITKYFRESLGIRDNESRQYFQNPDIAKNHFFKIKHSLFRRSAHYAHYLFVLRFYGPINPVGSCRARSVYLTIRLLGRLSPLSG